MRPRSDGSAAQQPLDRLDEEHVRAGEDVHARATVPPSSRRRVRVRRRRVPKSVCIEPVWTIRNTPSSRARGPAPRSRRARSRSGCRSRSDRPARASRARTRDRGLGRGHDDRRGARQRAAHPTAGRGRGGRAVGYRRISSSAHGSSRSATHGSPSSAASRAPAQRRLVGRARGEHDVGVGARPAAERRRTRSIHQRTQRSARAQAREPRGQARRASRLGARDAVDLGRRRARASSSGSCASQRPRAAGTGAR